MDTALPQKFPFILDRNLAKANCTGNRGCTSCDTVVLRRNLFSLPVAMVQIAALKSISLNIRNNRMKSLEKLYYYNLSGTEVSFFIISLNPVIKTTQYAFTTKK